MSLSEAERGARLQGAEDLYPMSDIELGMVYHSLEDPGLYHSQMLVPLHEAAFDLERLHRAFVLLAAKHPILRTGLNPAGFEQPIQIVYRAVEPDVAYEDLSRLDPAGQEAFLREFLAADLARPFVFHQPPLWRMRVFRLAADQLVLAWIMHHAITDGWSTACLVTELREIYARLAQDPAFTPAPLACTYRDFVVAELVEKRRPESIDFWRQELADCPRLQLSRKVDKASAQLPPRLQRHPLPAGLLAEARQAAQRQGVELRTLCFTAYAYLLRMLAMEDEIVCGLVTNTRPLCEDGERLAGCFLNTIPVRLALPAGRTWAEHLANTAAKLDQLKQYERMPLMEIARVAGERGEHANPFFDVLFNFVNFHVLDSVPAADRAPVMAIEGHTATNTWFDFTVSTTLDEFTVELIHRQDVFDAAEAARLCGYYETILTRLVQEPQAVARKSDILPKAERQRLLVEFNATDHPYPETAQTLAALFEAQAAATPNAPAVRYGDTVLTYADLNQRANALAGRLRGLGLGPDRVAALLLRRSQAMAVAVWGVLKAGAAYLPIDPDYPDERVAYLLANSHAAALVTTGDLESQAARCAGALPLVLADDPALAQASAPNPLPLNQPGDLAYVIYTSGSTGQPKGVMVEQRALINRVLWMQRRYPIGSGDVILQKTPYTFDVSVWEQVWWALTGAQVCFLPPGGEKDPAQIIAAVAGAGVTVLHFVPSMLQAFLGYLAVDPARRVPPLASLRQIFASGEALTPAQANQCNRLLHDRHGTRLANLYGPTEAAIDVTWFDCQSDADLDAVPIGRPIDNIRLHVLDQAGELQPPGAPGELCISGIGLARGYLGNPELTAQKFCANPLAAPEAVTDAEFARIYRTGDLARWRADGNLEFLGRLDHQVKIRGLRIEPGEIEDRLAGLAPVAQCLVQAVGPASAPRLAAYYTLEPKVAPLAARCVEIEAEGAAQDAARLELANGLPVFFKNRRETEFMFGEIFAERSYHWPELRLPAGAVVVDVGANLGLFSLWLGRFCPDARILACEPIPELHRLLALNCRLHGLAAETLNLALGASAGEAVFTYYPQASILSGAHPDPERELAAVRAFLAGGSGPGAAVDAAALDQVLAHRLQGQSLRCPVQTLSALLVQAGVARVDLLKIDVERAELEVLAGIADGDWPKIAQIVMEVHDDHGRLDQVTALLTAKGFRVAVRQDDALAGAGLCNLFAVAEGWQPEGGGCDLTAAALERLAAGPLADWPTPEAVSAAARAHLAAALPDYMVPAHFLPLPRFPLTTSGKIDRKALPAPAGPGQADRPAQGPRDELERAVAGVFARALAGDGPAPDPEAIDIRAGFFELGGDSLRCIAALSGLGQALGMEISLPDFLTNLSVAGLAEFVRGRRAQSAAQTATRDEDRPSAPRRPDPAHLHEPFPLGDIQAAYLVGRSRAFEIGGVATLTFREIELDLEPERLERALRRIIARHPMLRAVVLDSQRQQILPDPPAYRLAVEDLRGLEPEQREARIADERLRVSGQVFAPSRWPLFEFKALRLAERSHLLLVAIDALIMDGTSMFILADELARFYAEPDLALPPLEFSVRDYMLACAEAKASPRYGRDRAYWLTKLDEFPAPPRLPMRVDPAGLHEPRFASRRTRLEPRAWSRLMQRAAQAGLTPTALIAAVYARALAFWANQPDLALNLTLFNRQPFHPDVERMVGDFTSVLPLGVSLKAGDDLWQDAKRVGAEIFAGLEHRLYSGVEFMRELARRRKNHQRAQLPVILTSTLMGGGREPAGLGRERQSIGTTSQAHLDLSLAEDAGGLTLNLDYVADLFAPEVIEGLFGQIEADLRAVAAGDEPAAPAPPPDQATLIAAYNATAAPIPARTLDGLFSAQAQARPQAIAVECGGQSLTYAELERQAGRVAQYLRGRGAAGKLVGVMAARALGTVVNLLGVLTAGAGYVPLDPTHPAERIALLKADSGCVEVLQPDLWQAADLPELVADAPLPAHSPERVAYVIYTSGSTGEPKGVVITHAAAANTIQDMNQRFAVGPEDRVLGLSSFCFDLSVYDLFGALAAGARLVMVPDHRDLANLARLVTGRGITIWNSVPTLMDLLLRHLEGREAGAEASTGARPLRWSPAAAWRPEGDGIRIGPKVYDGLAAQAFPALYFLAQAGFQATDLPDLLPDLPAAEVEALVAELARDRVLVSTPLTPSEIFAGQAALTPNPWGEEILYNPAAYEQYKARQLARDPQPGGAAPITLEPGPEFPPCLAGRRSHREFATDRCITKAGFGRLLAALRQLPAAHGVRYHYASAGGLYPIDVYLHVKPGRVEGLAGGLYYYRPGEHRLHPLAPAQAVTRLSHFLPNRPIFDASAFTLFLVYDAQVSQPKYGGMGYFYACLDAGLLVGALTQAAELMGVGLCSIGDMDYAAIRPHFSLSPDQVFIHAVEGGLKADLDPADPVLAGMACPPPAEPVATPKPAPAALAAPSLRLVWLSGDWISLTLPERVWRRFPGARVVSLGGATEAAIWSVFHPVDAVDPAWRSIPYGRPLANQSMHVLDFALRHCPLDVAGEIFIGGRGVAAGYHHDPEKTAAVFSDHPDLGRLYRTGDFGVMRGQGWLEFLGRRDQQVKIRGHRIELGEIEAQLGRKPGLGEAVALVVRDAPAGEDRLCACYTAAEPISPGRLREHLAQMLPGHMLPERFVHLVRLPLTPNGKVDRQALMALAASAPAPERPR
ncbi:MAG: amino acid adenylation domain-containing protein, partial [Pseudomonadota bacterium]